MGPFLESNLKTSLDVFKLIYVLVGNVRDVRILRRLGRRRWGAALQLQPIHILRSRIIWKL